MKGFVFFVLCAACFFAYYPEPPLQSVIQENDIAAGLLNNSFNETNARNISMIVLNRQLQASGNMAIAGLSPLVDNATNGTLMVIIEKGSRMDGFGSGDFDGDGCIEIEKQKNAYYNITVEFRLNNAAEIAGAPTSNETIGAKTYSNAVDNRVSMPALIKAKAENATGNETLEIRLNGSVTFVYLIDDKARAFDGSCVSNEKIFEAGVDFNDSRRVLAAGINKLFFLIKPVLNEHWYRDNEIEWLLFSQSRIYEIEIVAESSEGGRESEKSRLYDFDVVRNEWGIAEIVSIENDTAPFIGRVMLMPAPISEKNATFSYLHDVKYADNLALGKKTFTIKAKDVFLGGEEKEYVIYSRQLSIGKNTETGSSPDWETTRKSVTAEPSENRVVWLFFGALGVAAIIMLSRFRLKQE